jgi:hypothetical protein
MTTLSEHDITIAVHATLDSLSIPPADIGRIMERSAGSSAHGRRRSRPIPLRIAAALAVAFLVVVAAGTQRGGAFGLSDRVEATIARVLSAFNFKAPTKPFTVMVQSYEGLPLPRIAADVRFPIVPPAGVPRSFAAKMTRSELRVEQSTSVQWLYSRGSDGPSHEMIQIIESPKGAPHIASPYAGTTVSMKLKPDGTLISAVRNALDPKRLAIEYFTVGRTQVAVIVITDNPTVIADQIRRAMSSR